MTPVDTGTCNYNDGQGPDDLKKATANWNARMMWRVFGGAGEQGLNQFCARPVAKSPDDMVVNHADRLHVRVNNRAPHKPESAFLEILTQCVGFR